MRQIAPVVLVQRFQAEEHFIGLLRVGALPLVEGLNEVDVEITLGLRGGTVVWSSEKQIAEAFDAAFLPFDLVLPYLEARVAKIVAALHQRLDGAIIGAV